MSQLQTFVAGGWGGYALIFAAGMLMTEPWRWMGVRLSRDLHVDSEIFRWVRAVSTAMVAGLVARLVVFPIGQLETVPLSVRLIAFAFGICVYLFIVRNLAMGVISGTACLVAGAILLAT